MKFVCLISGGIDSAVAVYLSALKGHEIILLHMKIGDFDIKPIVERLRAVTKQKLPLYEVEHATFLKHVVKQCDRRYTCILCKRRMYREAELLCKQLKADGIITGENLAQVASQTLENLYVLSKAVDVPVLRPLIGYNKEEIISIAKKIGTYELQNRKPCPYAPRKPRTKSTEEEVLAEEQMITLPLEPPQQI